MIEAYWATDGQTVWFRFNGKVYSRMLVKGVIKGRHKIRFQGSYWYMMPEHQCSNIEDVINLNVDLRYTK